MWHPDVPKNSGKLPIIQVPRLTSIASVRKLVEIAKEMETDSFGRLDSKERFSSTLLFTPANARVARQIF
jgi:hypothetical protein